MKALATLLLAALAVAPTSRASHAETIDVPALVDDPWEGVNRSIHGFNSVADRFVFRPLAWSYHEVMPDPVQTGVSRFFANLGMPVTMVNQALQGRGSDAARSFGRFAVNTTVGVAGLFDPAAHVGLPRRDDEDFGQTLASWGWRQSDYLVLPLFGPSTLRDTVGMLGDKPLTPLSYVGDPGVGYGLQGLQVVDKRVRLLPMDQMRRDALDEYAVVRDAWIQRRNRQIEQDLR